LSDSNLCISRHKEEEKFPKTIINDCEDVQYEMRSSHEFCTTTDYKPLVQGQIEDPVLEREIPNSKSKTIIV